MEVMNLWNPPQGWKYVGPIDEGAVREYFIRVWNKDQVDDKWFQPYYPDMEEFKRSLRL